MTDLINRAKAAVELHDIDHMDDEDWVDLAPDLARALIREREAGERLVDTIEADMTKLAFSSDTISALAAYRAAIKDDTEGGE